VNARKYATNAANATAKAQKAVVVSVALGTLICVMQPSTLRYVRCVEYVALDGKSAVPS